MTDLQRRAPGLHSSSGSVSTGGSRMGGGAPAIGLCSPLFRNVPFPMACSLAPPPQKAPGIQFDMGSPISIAPKVAAEVDELGLQPPAPEGEEDEERGTT